MKKYTLMFILVFSTVALHSLSVKSDELTSKYGVSYAERQASNYIEKEGYSFRYLGNGYWDINQLGQTANRRTAGSSTKDKSSGLVVVILIIIVGIIIIIGKCVSNITTAVAKNSGMDEASAKKVGASAGMLAGTAAAIGAAALLGKAGGYKNKNHITITHRRI